MSQRERLTARHKKLHQGFDELLACFIAEHPDKSNFLDVTLKEFMDWSHQMTINPTCVARHGSSG